MYTYQLVMVCKAVAASVASTVVVAAAELAAFVIVVEVVVAERAVLSAAPAFAELVAAPVAAAVDNSNFASLELDQEYSAVAEVAEVHQQWAAETTAVTTAEHWKTSAYCKQQEKVQT